MRPDDLFEAMGDIDEQFIDDRPIDIIPNKKRTPKWVKAVSLAASLALIVMAIGVMFWKSKPKIVYPDMNMFAKVSSGNSMWGEPEYLTYKDLANKSDIVVVADVVKTIKPTDPTSDTRLEPYATVLVQDVIKGDVQKNENLFIRDNGYIFIDEITKEEIGAFSFSGGPIMKKGNRVLLFLVKSDTLYGRQEFYEIADMNIGAFFYDTDGCFRAAAYYSLPNLWGTMLDDYTPKSIEEIKMLITR